MIQGFVTTAATAKAVNDAVAAAELADWGRVYWLPGAFHVHSGPHAGTTLIPLSDTDTTTVLRSGRTVADFPAFPQLCAALGGLDARVFLDPADLIDPNAPLS